MLVSGICSSQVVYGPRACAYTAELREDFCYLPGQVAEIPVWEAGLTASAYWRLANSTAAWHSHSTAQLPYSFATRR